MIGVIVAMDHPFFHAKDILISFGLEWNEAAYITTEFFFIEVLWFIY